MPASLSPGAHLGPYEIVGLIGAGGMGEVFRARDPRLGREVAVKILRAESLQVEDRRRRFELEARAASALNHPNILTIYDIGEEGGAPYIVCELLDGKSLREVMLRGALPIRQAVEISVEICAGLAAAHSAGITHRDLKPENLFQTRDGRIKILDFGLAKAAETVCPEDATRTLMEQVTTPGTVLGTLAYMSPEQARGETVDYRSDQFSLGTILYEMATGKRPFQGDDRVATLSAIVGKEPTPLSAAEVPAPVRWIVDRCLAKDPARRYSSTADLHRQLRDVLDHWSEVSTIAAAPAASPTRRRLAPALAVLGAIAAGFLLAVAVGPRAQAPEPLKYTPFATEAVSESQPAWSPDGQSLAYIAKIGGIPQVVTRALNASSPAQITRSESDCAWPFWSPDGTRIYYWSRGALWSVGAAGGAPQVAVPDVVTRGNGTPGAISPDGRTLAFFRADGPLIRLYIQSGGATPAAYRTPPFPAAFRYCDGMSISPDGKKLAVNFVEKVDVKEGSQLWIVPLPGGTPTRVLLKFDKGARPRPFVWTHDNRHMILSVEVLPGEGNHLCLLDTETGDFRRLTSGAGEERDPSVSPDGRRIAFTNGVDDSDLIEFSIDGTRATPLLATSRREYGASWAPSGQQYVYGSNASGEPGIWIRSLAEGWVRLVSGGSALGYLEMAQPRFSPDGQRLAYMRAGGEHAIYVSNLSGGPAVPLERESSDQHAPAWSPDGNWIAYSRYMGQSWEVVKAPAGGGGTPVRLCSGGESTAWLEWSPDGRSICFADPAGVGLVSADGGEPRRIHGQCAGFSYTKDSSAIYVVRRAKGRNWELAKLQMPDGAELSAVPLNLSTDKDLRNISLHPDGTRFVATVYTSQRDIWILEGAKLR